MTNSLPNLPAIKRLSPLIIRILGGNPSKFTLQGTNTYLIGAGRTRVLIDTGEGFPAWRDALSTVLREEKCSVTDAFLTHHHQDHVQGVADLLALSPGARVYKHPAPEGVPDPPTVILPIEDGQSWHVPTVEGEGEEWAGGMASLKAMYLPGHTKDHCVFFLDEEASTDGGGKGMKGTGVDMGWASSSRRRRTIFTGDAVLGHGTAVFQDLAEYLAGLEKLARMSAEEEDWGQAFPGHGEVIEDPGAKVREYLAHRKMREDQVVDALARGPSEGMTARQIVEDVYRDVPANLHDAAEVGVRQILMKLEGEGRAEQLGNDKWRLRSEAAFSSGSQL